MGFVFACGYCEAPLKGPADSSSNSMFKCPCCGQAETSDNVKRIVGEFLKESARNKIEEMLRVAASNSESLAYSDVPRSKASIALSPSRQMTDLRLMLCGRGAH
jgi:hypothetical protein